MFALAPLQYLNRGGRFMAGLAIFFCAFIAFFRGNVGTDTSAYISIFEDVANGASAPYVELGFGFLTNSFLFLFSDPELSVKIVSLIFFGLLFIFLIRSNRDERFLLLSFVLPVFSYSYSMNVLRAGIAAAIALLIFQSVMRSGVEGKLKYFFLSISFQYTAVVMPLFFYVLSGRWVGKIPRKYILFSAFLFVVFAIEYKEYFFDKISLYQRYESPNIYSGLSNLTLIIFILFFLSFGYLPKRDKIRIILRASLAAIVIWVFSRFSYAGLRVLDMLTFVIPWVIFFLYRENNIPLDRYVRFGIYISGIIFSFNIYIGYVAGQGEGDSPFLPYKFSFLN